MPLRQRLDGWAAKVAVIGQVKAGKSTFVNALLHWHDFLPSDINPWTSVVTDVRINIPGDPATGARFDFFTETDWQEIIGTGTRIRALTEELLPGFDSELLRRQSEEMCERAQRRLGRHYHALLGGQHDYEHLSPDLLRRYVCAGPGNDDGLEREALGRYAALTKNASIYMQLPEFAVPTIITDTPGVNDPFLVRDEITCRSLDRSDVFVMVLSAHQPLTDVDIALIRILARQDAKDVMIFVNRIDELDEFAQAVPRVLADVAQRLRDAIPEIDFRIVAGSAWFAGLAIAEDDSNGSAREAADNEELAQYLHASYGQVPQSRSQRLMLASGLNDLKSTLSELIDQGVGSRQLGQFRGDIRAELDAVLFIGAQEQEALAQQLGALCRDTAQPPAEDPETAIAAIRALRDSVVARIDAADAEIERAVATSWAGLESRLNRAVDAFVDGQKSVFQDRLFGSGGVDGGDGMLVIDTTPLQDFLETEVRESFAAARPGTDAILEQCIDACRTIITSRFQDPTANINLSGLPYDSFTSSLTSTRRSLRVGLIADRSWAFWRKPSVSLGKTVAALRTIAAEELRAPVEKILAAYSEAQLARATAGMSRIRVMLRMFDTVVNEQAQRLNQEKAERQRQTASPKDLATRQRDLRAALDALEQRMLTLSSLDAALKRSEMRMAA
nr:dynamin family protein [Pseudogemmobacter hezensis]